MYELKEEIWERKEKVENTMVEKFQSKNAFGTYMKISLIIFFSSFTVYRRKSEGFRTPHSKKFLINKIMNVMP